jgi:uncharacterized protein (DUF1778 family)
MDRGTEVRMTLMLELSPEQQQRLESAAAAKGVSPAEFAVKTIDERLADEDRRQRAIALLRSWREEGNAEQQRETMEYLIKALDEDRTSDRKLFPPELKGISW